MRPPPIVSWGSIEDEGWKNLLLGNGFSINIDDGFDYDHLLRESSLPGPAKALFTEIGTADFEAVMRVLAAGVAAARALGLDEVGGFEAVYAECRDALIEAVREVHVEYRDLSPKMLCDLGIELAHYCNVFTTNYDLLIYWSTMEAGRKHQQALEDFFRRPRHHLEWQPDEHTRARRTRPAVHFLHGALHLAVHPLTGAVIKIAAGPTSALLEEIQDVWTEGVLTPLYVSEGDAAQKRRAIAASPYLMTCYEALQSMDAGCVVLGHRLGTTDAHIVDAITRAGVPLAIGLHGDAAAMEADALRLRESLAEGDVTFFRSSEHPLTRPQMRGRP